MNKIKCKYRTLDGEERQFKKIVSSYKLNENILEIPKLVIFRNSIEYLEIDGEVIISNV